MPAKHHEISPDYGTTRRRGATVEEPTENARQGVSGHHVHTVLAISTAAIVVIFAIIYVVLFGT